VSFIGLARSSLERSWAQSRILTILLGGILGGTLLVNINAIRRTFGYDYYVPEWQLTQYWLNYEGQFVRRGLPGELLSWFTGGSPGLVAAQAAGVLLSLIALGALGLLAVRAAALAATPLRQLALLVVLSASPLTFSHVLNDVGRYDAVGVVAATATALMPWRRLWPAAIAVGLLVAIAVASEEFLLAILLPIVLLSPAFGGWRTRPVAAAGIASVTLGPATALALASVLTTPSARLIRSTTAEASLAGLDVPNLNAVSALSYPPTWFVQWITPITIATYVATMVVFFLVAIAAVAWVTRIRLRFLLGIAGYYIAVGLALGMAGVDYRRWWFLALVGLVACAVRAGPDHSREAVQPIETWPAWTALLAALTICLPAQLHLPIAPALPSAIQAE
jgi:hypothetical protein